MTLPEELCFPSAVSCGFLGPGDEEWHRVRDHGISGTDVAVILGLSPWNSAFSLWHQKAGLRGLGPLLDGVRDNPAMAWGRRLEPVIADHYASLHPDVSVLESPLYRSTEHEWQVVTPDRILVHQDGARSALEIKTAGSDDGWKNGVPVYYRCQVLWQLDVLSLQEATVAVLFGGRDYREYTVQYDADDARVLREAAEEFHKSLEAGVQPPLDGAGSTYEAVRAVHAGVDDVDAEVSLEDAQAYADALRSASVAGERVNLWRSTLLDRIGSGRRAVCGSLTVATRTVRDGKTWSLKPGKGLLEEFPAGVEGEHG